MSYPQFVETIKVKDGVFYNLPLHQQRLLKTSRFFYNQDITLELSNNLIPHHLKKGLVKCRVVYTSKIESIEFEPYAFKTLECLRIVEDNEIRYQYKSTNRDRLNSLSEKKGRASDIIIVKNELATDASYANLVFQNQEGLFTPKSCLLAGTKRSQLLNEGKIQEMDIKITDIASFTKVYLINAMIDLEDNVSTSVVLL